MSGDGPARGGHGYADRVGEALVRYEAAAGSRPPAEALDPARPEVRRSYRAFARAALPPIGIRPGLGEELALRLGLKPVLRLLTDPRGVDRLAAHFARDGFATLATSGRRRESTVDGLVAAAEPGEDGRVLFYAGRRPDDVAEAAALDGALFAALPDGAAATRRLGVLLGYPSCCVEAFTSRWPVPDNATPIAAAAARSLRFDPRLDNLTLSVCHLTGWFPCRYDCAASLEVAAAVEGALAARDRAGAARLRRFLSMPRLYADDRRQLVLDGDVVGPGRVRLRAVHTPYAFDRDPAEAAYEWVFFADVAAPLVEGGTLTVASDALVLETPGRAPLRRARPAASVWLPFAG
ncbi:MAG TPA: hypothetical protein VF841_11125 [Anaeromyxobacter sp.]